MLVRTRRAILFPYTTLFRSGEVDLLDAGLRVGRCGRGREGARPAGLGVDVGRGAGQGGVVRGRRLSDGRGGGGRGVQLDRGGDGDRVAHVVGGGEGVEGAVA